MNRTVMCLLVAMLFCVPALAQQANKPDTNAEEEGIFNHPEWPPPVSTAEDTVVTRLDDMKKCSEPHMRRGLVNVVGELAKNKRIAIRQPIIQYILDELVFRLSGGDYDFEVRKVSVEAVIKVCDRKGVDERIKYLTEKMEKGEAVIEKPEDVEKAYKNQAKQVKDALLKALKEDKKNEVREQCSGFLPEIATDDEAIKGLTEALLGDGWSSVREISIRSLVKIKNPACIPALKKALENDPYSTVRAAAANALLTFDVKDALPLFIKGLEDGWSRVRLACMKAIVEFGTGESVKHIMDRLFDKKYDVRMHAVKALGRLGDETALPSLKKAASDEYEEVREQVYEAIAKIGATHSETAKTAADILADKGLGDKVANPHMAAISGLIELKDKRGMDALIEILAGNYPVYRKISAIDLAITKEMKDPQIIKILSELANSDKAGGQIKQKAKDAKEKLGN